MYSVWNMLAWNGRGSYLCKKQSDQWGYVNTRVCVYEGVWERVWECVRKIVYPSVFKITW